ncbi:H/ACA ribonucleoprotein complex, subunit Gar1/Naf1, partial [Suillus subaureus]
MNRGARGFSRGGRGGGRGGFQQRDFGPPATVVEMGTFMHAVEDEMLCSSLISDRVPYFNAPIYLQNKSVIGKVDEILGPINEVYFSVKMGEGMVASSFKQGDKVYIGGDKLLPIERFLPKPKVAERGRGIARGSGPRGRGAPGGRGRGGRGASRGGVRGGFGGDRG